MVVFPLSPEGCGVVVVLVAVVVGACAWYRRCFKFAVVGYLRPPPCAAVWPLRFSRAAFPGTPPAELSRFTFSPPENHRNISTNKKRWTTGARSRVIMDLVRHLQRRTMASCQAKAVRKPSVWKVARTQKKAKMDCPHLKPLARTDDDAAPQPATTKRGKADNDHPRSARADNITTGARAASTHQRSGRRTTKKINEKLNRQKKSKKQTKNYRRRKITVKTIVVPGVPTTCASIQNTVKRVTQEKNTARTDQECSN